MPFPYTYPNVLADDIGITGALAAAIAEAQLNFPALGFPLRIAISIVAVDESTSPSIFKHAGFRENEMHYSASLLKVAAMYAAYELRRAANNFAHSSTANDPAELFAQLGASVDPLIENAVSLISNTPNIQRWMKLPKYQNIFDVVPLGVDGFEFIFSDSFFSNMKDMIVRSDNSAAGKCVEQLGYSWINGVLANGGFFNPETVTGIWLAGTFTQSWPYVRVSSVNDGPVAQATTTFDLANLYALIFQRTLVDSTSCDAMLALIAESAVGPDPSWMEGTRRRDLKLLPTSFIITHTKIGLGPLKAVNGGVDVTSEGTIVEHVPTRRKFIVVWQNCENNEYFLRAVSFIVDKAINLFVSQIF